MESLEDVLDEGSKEYQENTRHSEQCNCDAEGHDMSGRGSCSLLSYHHVGVPALRTNLEETF